MLAGTRSGGRCARTSNNWLWHDDFGKRRMTAHCSTVLPKMVNLIKIAEAPDIVSERGVQPRRAAHRLRRRRQDGAGVGRRHRPADRRSR